MFHPQPEQPIMGGSADIPPAIHDLTVDPRQLSQALIQYLGHQPQGVLAHVIAAQSDPQTQTRDQVLCWLVSQPLYLANAVRLFWALFDLDLYLNGARSGAAEDPGQALRLDLLRLLSRGITSGEYPRGDMGISARQSKALKIQLVEDTRDAVLQGWDQVRDAGFQIPDACLMPLTGRMLGTPPQRRNLPLTLQNDAPWLAAQKAARDYVRACCTISPPTQRSDRQQEARHLRRADVWTRGLMVMMCLCAAGLGARIWQQGAGAPQLASLSAPPVVVSETR